MTTIAQRLRGATVQERAQKTETAELGTFAPLIRGAARQTGDDVAVRSPYDDRLVAVVHRAGPAEIEAAIAAAVEAFQETRRLPSWQREQILGRIAVTIANRKDELSRTIAPEAAKPLKAARLAMLTFTGSPAVGWALRARAGRKPVTLELGGNAPVIVHADADASYAAERIAWGATVQSGQSCISVQRVYVHGSLWDSFVPDLVARIDALRTGDPLDPDTDVGPLIDTAAADRVEAWVQEAVDAGARILTGGARQGRVYEPTVLADVKEDMRVSCQEVFAPVVGVVRYDDVTSAIRAAGTSEFGLQAGLFTNDLRVIDEAFDELETGGLVVNDVSTFRVDHMPYGGVKSSGSGREGLRYAIEEMTELKLLTLNDRR